MLRVWFSKQKKKVNMVKQTTSAWIHTLKLNYNTIKLNYKNYYIGLIILVAQSCKQWNPGLISISQITF